MMLMINSHFERRLRISNRKRLHHCTTDQKNLSPLRIKKKRKEKKPIVKKHTQTDPSHSCVQLSHEGAKAQIEVISNK
jgi:hypothetical protein